jgi:hypothetical protein
MLIVETKSGNAARKWFYCMLVACLVTGSYGLLLTMHFYARPQQLPVPQGVRFFGLTGPRARKLVLFVMSSAMLVGGTYFLAAELLWATRWFGTMFLMGATLVLLGAYLLWADFIAPAFGIKAEQ